MVLFLREDEVKELLTMDDAVAVLEETLRQQGTGGVINHPRLRVKTGKSMLHYLAGAVPYLGVMGYKAYTSYRGGATFRVFLHSIENGELLSIMEADFLGMIRTGAATAVATKYMSKEASTRVGIFGTGWQARGQLMGVSAVRKIERVKAYSRNRDNRARFCKEMEDILGVEIIPVERPEDVLKDVDILVTATTSVEPVFRGEWLQGGVHINAIGANFLFKRELDEETIRRSDIVVVDSKEQAKLEAGELLPPIDKGRIRWEDVYELGEIVVGKVKGRIHEEDITLFKSLGIAIEDIAVAARVYELAVAKGLGKKLEIPSI